MVSQAAGARPTGRIHPLPDRVAYALVAYGIAAVTMTGTVAIAFYHDYSRVFHFSSFVLTAIAAVPAVGVLVSVLLSARLSDTLGRKVILLPALGIAVLCQLSFLLADGTAWLFAGRLCYGLATGTYTGAATAALADLHPQHNARRAASLAAAMTVTGFAFGPLVGGLFLQYGPWPLRLAYVFGLATLVPPLLAAALMRETVVRPERWSLRPQRLRIPQAGRGTFALAGLVALCAWSFAALFQSLGPSIVIVLLGVSNRVTAAAAVVCFLGASAAAQLRLREWPTRRLTLTGLVLQPAGLALLISAVISESLPVFIVGAAVGGVGQGTAYLGGQSLVESIAPPRQRGEIFSTYLVLVFLSGALPALALGLLANAVGLHRAMIAYGVACGLLSLVAAALVARVVPSRPPRRPAG